MKILRYLDGRIDQRADIRSARYEGPVGSSGLARMRYPGGDVSFLARGPRRTWAPGTLLPTGSHLGGPHRVILQDAAPGQIGASSRSLVRYPAQDATAPIVFDLIPSRYESGGLDQPGSARGIGFQPGHRLVVTRHVVQPDETADDIQDERFHLHTQDVVSSTEITFLLDVDPEVPEGYRFDCALVFP